MQHKYLLGRSATTDKSSHQRIDQAHQCVRRMATLDRRLLTHHAARLSHARTFLAAGPTLRTSKAVCSGRARGANQVLTNDCPEPPPPVRRAAPRRHRESAADVYAWSAPRIRLYFADDFPCYGSGVALSQNQVAKHMEQWAALGPLEVAVWPNSGGVAQG